MEKAFFEMLLAQYGGLNGTQNIHCIALGSGRLIYIHETPNENLRYNAAYDPALEMITITNVGISPKTSDVADVVEYFHISAVETLSFWPS